MQKRYRVPSRVLLLQVRFWSGEPGTRRVADAGQVGIRDAGSSNVDAGTETAIARLGRRRRRRRRLGR